MADVAAARREARRRRILENSQNRLQRISGKVSEETFRESPSKFSYSEESTIVPESNTNSIEYFSLPVQNGSIFSDNSESVTVLSAPTARDTEAAGDTEIANDLAAFMTSAPEPEPKKTLWDKITFYKYDTALLALINHLCYIIFIFDVTYFFLPVIIYSITKLIWYPISVQSNIANAFLLLNGMSANRVHSIMALSQWFVVISQDVCVYLFVTICTQSLFIMLSNLFT